MNNYICTSQGFVKSSEFDQEKQEVVVEYTEKVRDAQQFNTKAATKFMGSHGIEGFVWKPYEQDAIRNMYYVKKRQEEFGYDMNNNRNPDKTGVQEWMPVKAVMASDSDVAFLTTKKLKAEDVMTFEEAKTEALRLNMEMLTELNEKLNELTDAVEPIK